MKGNRSEMYKILLLVITVGGFVFAGSWEGVSKSVEKSDSVKNQFCLAGDTSKDDFKLERRRRAGRGDKKRRRGGSGLR